MSSESGAAAARESESKLVERQKSLKWLNLTADSLLRLSVIHESTGLPLFDNIWKWRGHPDPLHFADLVQTALKVGGSIKDSGGLRYILFEPIEPSPHQLSSSGRSPAQVVQPGLAIGSSSHSGLLPRHKTSSSAALFKVSPQVIRLVFLKSAGFVVSVVHGVAAPWETVDALVSSILGSFLTRYQSQVEDMSADLRLKERAKSKGQPVDVAALQAPFQDFAVQVENEAKRLSLV
jgi:hypothetical protein